MKHFCSLFFSISLIFCSLIVRGQKKNNNSLITTQLNTNWSFKSTDETLWLKANVPGTVHTDLLDNKKIEDPFYRLNEHNLQWIDKKDWEYKTQFEVNEQIFSRENIDLEFTGLDTYASVFLNGSLILQSDNMFRTYTVSCKKFLKKGSNTLLIRFDSPIKKGIEKHDAISYKIPVSNNDLAEIGKVEGNKLVSVFTRKAGYHFGWDWGPRLVSSGIWRHINLKAWNTFKIEDLAIKQLELNTSAKLNALIEIQSIEDKKAEIELLVDGLKNTFKVIDLKKGIHTYTISLEILKPELWWPNGMGNQKLYSILAKVKSEGIENNISKKIGLRTIELVQEPDSIGTSFYFKVNGYPVFMKGANYIPQDIFLTEVDSLRYEKTLNSAKDANMNMLRVWGGGVYESDLFYNLCDEKGLLIWQDFMFACAMFPSDKDFLNNVRQEAYDNVKRLRNHPSIALWSGNNEILSAWKNWGWEKDVIKNQGQAVADTIWYGYDKIFHKILPEVINNLDKERPYWPSSPGSAFGEKEDQQSYKQGDAHFWGVWWAKEPFENYEKVMPRFMSEYGFQSFPELSSVEKYAVKEDYNIFSEVMKSHQRSTIGNGTIDEYMKRHYKNPKDFESFLYVGQLLQAYGIGYGMEAHRRNRARCMGSLYWQIDDCWPVASWSSIDYFGKWKAVHYATKKAFEPIIISTKENGENTEIHIISDLLTDKKGTLEFNLTDFKGNKINSKKEPLIIKANRSSIYSIMDTKELLKNYKKEEVLLSMKFYDEKGNIAEKLFYFTDPKNLNLPTPTISFDVIEKDNTFYVTLKTDFLAKNIFVASTSKVNFSDNYFDLLPNEIKTISIPKSDLNLIEFKKSIKLTTLVDTY